MTTPATKAILAIAWTTLKGQAGETVTYTSGDESVELTAVVTRPKAAQVEGGENIVFESRAWDVLIDPEWPDDAPAAFDGLQPSHGDTITRADGTVYQVQPRDGLDACWRYSEGQHAFRRVMTEERQ